MIEVTRGDILKADAEALVNTVNCVGVMGRGIAAQFKRAYPKNFSVYQQACKRHEVQPGRMLIVETGQLAAPRWVINFPTKRHWRGNSRIEDIDAGLAALVADIRRLGITSIAVPPLGCGLGGPPGHQGQVRSRSRARTGLRDPVRHGAARDGALGGSSRRSPHGRQGRRYRLRVERSQAGVRAASDPARVGRPRCRRLASRGVRCGANAALKPQPIATCAVETCPIARCARPRCALALRTLPRGGSRSPTRTVNAAGITVFPLFSSISTAMWLPRAPEHLEDAHVWTPLGRSSGSGAWM